MALSQTKRGAEKCKSHLGFTLTELITTVTLAGTIAAVGTPIYINQNKASCQRSAEAQLSLIMSQAQAFNDEYGALPQGWNDLDKISSLMTNSGAAKGESFSKISLPSCNYTFSGTKKESSIDFLAAPPTSKSSQPDSDTAQETEDNKSGYDVIGCINVLTGASQIRRGDGSESAQKFELLCEQT